jgi:PKD domain
MWILLACSGITTVPDKTDSLPPLTESEAESGPGPIDSENHDGNQAPVADAGSDVTVSPGIVVALDGSGSHDADGDPLTYAWRLTDKPRGSNSNLLNPQRLDAQFVPDQVGVYTIELTVNDGVLGSDPDEVLITVAEENGTPVANAGSAQTVQVGDQVILDGSSSYDPDGDSLRYSWTLVSSPSGSAAALSNPGSSSPRFTADRAGSYEVSLVVSDGGSSSAADTVSVQAVRGDTGGGGGGGGSSGCLGCAAVGGDMVPALLVAFGSLSALWRGRRRSA